MLWNRLGRSYVLLVDMRKVPRFVKAICCRRGELARWLQVELESRKVETAGEPLYPRRACRLYG